MEGVELPVRVRQVKRVVRLLKNAQSICEGNDQGRGDREKGDHWGFLEGCSNLK